MPPQGRQTVLHARRDRRKASFAVPSRANPHKASIRNQRVGSAGFDVIHVSPEHSDVSTAKPSHWPIHAATSAHRPTAATGTDAGRRADPVRAVSIGLAPLKAALVQSWDDLADTLRTDDHPAARLDGVELTRDDLALLDQHLGLLGLIRVMPGARGTGHAVTSRFDAGLSRRRCPRWVSGAGHNPVPDVRSAILPELTPPPAG